MSLKARASASPFKQLAHAHVGNSTYSLPSWVRFHCIAIGALLLSKSPAQARKTQRTGLEAKKHEVSCTLMHYAAHGGMKAAPVLRLARSRSPGPRSIQRTPTRARQTPRGRSGLPSLCRKPPVTQVCKWLCSAVLDVAFSNLATDRVLPEDRCGRRAVALHATAQ